jgi:probable F420-dependent oxidoreductase
MKFALHFGNSNAPGGEAAKRLALAAEQAGFESVIAVEHVVWPTNYASSYPYAPSGRLPGGPATRLPDPLIWFAYIGAVTTKLRFLTGILILPQRNPLVLAKELATLDEMTGGRISLGIGVGWLREEFEALGVPFEHRGRRTDEYIAAMRALWAKDDASFEGEFVKFRGMSCNPKPVSGAVPIVVGGHTSTAARRAGRIGDGFFPATGAQLDVEPLIALARQTAREAGRDPAALEITTGCPGALPGSGRDPLAAIAERAAAGVDRVALPIPAFLPDLEAKLAEFGDKVIAKAGG